MTTSRSRLDAIYYGAASLAGVAWVLAVQADDFASILWAGRPVAHAWILRAAMVALVVATAGVIRPRLSDSGIVVALLMSFLALLINAALLGSLGGVLKGIHYGEPLGELFLTGLMVSRVVPFIWWMVPATLLCGALAWWINRRTMTGSHLSSKPATT